MRRRTRRRRHQAEGDRTSRRSINEAPSSQAVHTDCGPFINLSWKTISCHSRISHVTDALWHHVPSVTDITLSRPLIPFDLFLLFLFRLTRSTYWGPQSSRDVVRFGVCVYLLKYFAIRMINAAQMIQWSSGGYTVVNAQLDEDSKHSEHVLVIVYLQQSIFIHLKNDNDIPWFDDELACL